MSEAEARPTSGLSGSAEPAAEPTVPSTANEFRGWRAPSSPSFVRPERPGGFDRDAMHEVMNPEIVGFFNRKLRPGGNTFEKGPQLTPSRSARDSQGG